MSRLLYIIHVFSKLNCVAFSCAVFSCVEFSCVEFSCVEFSGNHIKRGRPYKHGGGCSWVDQVVQLLTAWLA